MIVHFCFSIQYHLKLSGKNLEVTQEITLTFIFRNSLNNRYTSAVRPPPTGTCTPPTLLFFLQVRLTTKDEGEGCCPLKGIGKVVSQTVVLF